MSRKMCKRIFVLLMAYMLCFESTQPVFATGNSNAMLKTGLIGKEMPEGMVPFDISEEAIAAAEVSEEEFMQEFGLDRAQIEASETEMERALGIAAPVAEEVSANTVSANSEPVSQEKATTYATLEDAAEYLRGKMVARKNDIITIRVAGSKDTSLKNVEKILNKVFEYDINGAPNEGDYLYWHMKGMRWTTPSKQSDGTYTIRFQFVYRTTAAEEKYVTREVNTIVKKLNLKSSALNEYQKVRAIYDYIMSIIEYDYYHYENDQSYNYMYTTYEALNSGFAVCQAYASLFYRLCEEVDISARVICGNDDASGKPTHGWNIVKIGSYYYNLDATWDDTSDARTHIYFLKNMADFTGHQRNKVNAGSAFDKQFPTSPVSYPTPEADILKSMVNVNNISGELLLTDGSNYSLGGTNGKAKVLFFVDPSYTAISWLEWFFTADCLQSGSCDAIVIDIFDQYSKYEPSKPASIMAQIMTYASNPARYKFSSDYANGLNYKEQYAILTGKPKGCYSSVAVIDANNHLRYFNYVENAMADVDKVMMELSYNSAYGTVNALNLTQTQNDQVQLSWSPYSGATGYRIYRKTAAGAYCCVGMTTGTSFVDEVDAAGSYVYQVRALNSFKEIASSPEKGIVVKTMLLKKGKTYTVDGYKYKVLKSTNGTKTVAFTGVSNKKLTKILIPNSVEINGLTYKVTEVAAKALKGNKKVKTVSVGANVTKIGKQAFYNAKKLANIVVKTKKLKSVGSKALYGISKKAEIRVPSSKYKKYQKVFKGKGQKSSVKIKK